MADKEFEEFRQFFEQLPQHIKAPSNCYTDGVVEDAIVAQTVQEVRQEVQQREKGIGGIPSSGPLAWSTALQSRYAPEDIFNAGKISFYYNYLPESCRAFRSSVRFGSDKSRGRRRSSSEREDVPVTRSKTPVEVTRSKTPVEGWRSSSSRSAAERKAQARQRRKSNPEVRQPINWKHREQDDQSTKKDRFMRIHGRDMKVIEGDQDSLVHRMKTKLEERITSSTRSIHSRTENHRIKKRSVSRENGRKKNTKLDKKPKKLLTALFISNMTGSAKLPILVIGRTNLRITSKTAKTLPTAYMCSNEVSPSSLTPEIFEYWIKQQDDIFLRSKRKVALILDSVMQEMLPPKIPLKSIEVINLPGHIAYKSHPIEGKLSKEIRTQYKLNLLDSWFRSSKDIAQFQVSILDAMYILRRVWEATESSSIRKSFRACGIIPEGISFPEEAAEDLGKKVSTEDFVLQCGIGLKAFEDWVSAEDEINKRIYSTEEEILTNVEKEIISGSKAKNRMAKDKTELKSPQSPETPESSTSSESLTLVYECKPQYPDATTQRKKPPIYEKDKEYLYGDDETSEDDDEEAASAFLPPNGRQMRAACSALQSFIMACPDADEMLAHLALIENFCISQDIKSRIKNMSQDDARSSRSMTPKMKSPMDWIEKLV